MNHFRKHIPSFVDSDDPRTPVPFTTTEELLAIPFVAQWARDVGFTHYALSERLLMAIRDEGFHWWVVGSVDDPSTVQLPQWDGGKYHVRMPDGTDRIIGKDEVSSVCGNEVRLRDGGVARNLRRP